MAMRTEVVGTPPSISYVSAGGVSRLTPAGVAAMTAVAQTYLTAATVAATAQGANFRATIGSYGGGWPIVPTDAAAQLTAVQGVLNAAANVSG